MLLQGRLRTLLVIAGVAILASPAFAQCGKRCGVKPATKAATVKVKAQGAESNAKPPCCETGCKPGCCPECPGCRAAGAADAKTAIQTSARGGCGATKAAARAGSQDAPCSGCKPGCCPDCPPDRCREAKPGCCPEAAASGKTAIKTSDKGGCGSMAAEARTVSDKAVVGGCCGKAKAAKKVTAEAAAQSPPTNDGCGGCGGCVPDCCDKCPENCRPAGTPGCCPDADSGCGSKTASTPGKVLARVVSALVNPVAPHERSTTKPCCGGARER